MSSVLLVVVFTLLCGLGDALGFIHAGRVWQHGQFHWSEAMKSALGFQFGVAMYWLALRELTAWGVVSAETQTMVWFGATIVGVAALSGQLLHWHPADQIVALAVMAGIGWLLFSHRGMIASPFRAWRAADYLAQYYGAVEADEAATLRFLVQELQGIGPVASALEFGAGPTLHHALPLAPHANAIDMADPLPDNRAALRRWLHRRRHAHDWRPFTRHVLACEGRPADDAAVDARERLVRRRVRRLLDCDAASPQPLGTGGHRHYDIVLSCFCADSATDDQSAWRRWMRHIGRLVAPGGWLLLASLRRCRAYRVGEQVFPSADVDEHDIARCLVATGFERRSAHIEVEPVPLGRRLGYDGIVLASARRRIAAAAADAPGASLRRLTPGAARPATRWD